MLLDGGAGNDRLEGGAGNDILTELGSTGYDLFLGQGNNDRLWAAHDGGYSDRLYGGSHFDHGNRDSNDASVSVEDLETFFVPHTL